VAGYVEAQSTDLGASAKCVQRLARDAHLEVLPVSANPYVALDADTINRDTINREPVLLRPSSETPGAINDLTTVVNA
jgi:hypothetical protein